MGPRVKNAAKMSAQVELPPYKSTFETLQTELCEGTKLAAQKLVEKGLVLDDAKNPVANLKAFVSDDQRVYFKFLENYNSPKFSNDKRRPFGAETTVYYELKQKDGAFELVQIKAIDYDARQFELYEKQVKEFESSIKIRRYDYFEIYLSADKSKVTDTVAREGKLTKKRFEGIDSVDAKFGTDYRSISYTVFFAIPTVGGQEREFYSPKE